MTRLARVLIDPDALRHNLQRARAAAPGRRLLAVVKAGGYGHGMVAAARALAGADGFGVATVGEGLALREAGLSAPVLVLEGPAGPAEVEAAAAAGLAVVLHHEAQLRWLEEARPPRPVPVWVKLDTGMHRLGFDPAMAPALAQRLAACAAAAPPPVWMTHFANADDRDDPLTTEQIRRFAAAVDGLPGARSLANSAGVLGWPGSHGDWVRPGIMLYGASPFAGATGPELELRPAMTFTSRLIAVHRRRRGEALGYGGEYVCPEDMPVGVVAAGYGDGYPRHAAAGTPVLVGGRRVSLVGRVSMDMITVDLRAHPEARVGDPVVLWGEGLPVEEVARHAGTIAYELLCHAGARPASREVLGPECT